MALKVEIYQKEIVRPFSPTPESLRNYKLSILDQLQCTNYIPSAFFFNSGTHHHDYDHLKESLSKTLSVYYPLAGRVKDGFTIECNDEGAEFVRANVTNYDLTHLHRFPKVQLLQQLFPREPFPVAFDHSLPMLALQVNKFRCGGTVMAICFWHGVGDGAALARFVQTWAAINRGGEATNRGGGVIVANAATKMFPQTNYDFYSATSSSTAGRKRELEKYCMKRFVFNNHELELMKAEHNNGHRRLGRIEVLSAFVWAALIRATLQAKQNLKTYVITHAVDLRKRMNPPFPPMCLGNIIQACTARWEADETGENDVITSQSLLGRIQEAFAKVTGDYVKKMHDEGYVKVLTLKMGEILAGANTTQTFAMSSAYGFPWLECDFGWGKPIWVAPVVTNTLKNNVFFFNNTHGIEMWIGLSHEVMSNLDKDNVFLAHVSYSQVISQPISKCGIIKESKL